MYKVLVKQQIVKSVSDLFIFIVGIILIFLAAWLGTKSEWDGPDFTSLFCVFGGLAGLICVLFGIFNFTEIIQGFVNPEYGAVKDIISFFN